MSLSLLPEPIQSYEDASGRPLNGGMLFTYAAGTTTPKATYQDAAGAIPNTNPIVLNERGEATLYGNGNYRFVLKNSFGATIWDRDNVNAAVSASDLSGNNGATLIGYDGTTLDQFFKSRLLRVVDSIAQLRALDKTKYTRAFVTGYYAAGDGGGTPYWYDSTDTTSADNGGTVIVADDGARWKPVYGIRISSKMFGVKGDKTADDTAAVQRYFNWCNAVSPPRKAIMDGMCRLTASVNIDRLVDTNNNEFIIESGPLGGGFYADSTVNLFDSTLSMPGVDPVSEFVTFKDIRFEANLAGTGAYCLTQKFLRMKFINCQWYKIRLIAAATYIQSYYFIGCNNRFWPGTWCGASHAFDTHMMGCINEFGADYLFTLPNGSYSLTIRDSNCEGGGSLLQGGGFRQLVIDGNYLEGNAKPNIDMTNGTQNVNVTITNNQMQALPANVANPAFYDVVWGNTVNPRIGGNMHFNGRLHDNTVLPAPADSGAPRLIGDGDSAALAVFRQPKYASQASDDCTLASTIGGGTFSYQRYRRNGKIVTVEFNYKFPSSASGSPAIITGLPFACANNIFGGDVVFTGQGGEVRLIGGAGSGIAGVGNDSFAVCQNLQGLPYSYATLSGKNLAGVLTYQI